MGILMKVGSFEAKTRFSELIDVVRGGGEVVVTKRGVPVARIVPFESGRLDKADLLRRFASIRSRSKNGPSAHELIVEGRH
jgi:prevent-host-death family protein